MALFTQRATGNCANVTYLANEISNHPLRNCSEYHGEVESSDLDAAPYKAVRQKGEPLDAKSYLSDGFGVRDVGWMRGNAAAEGCRARCNGCLQCSEFAGHDFGQAGRLYS